jgi:hypothetical protein
MHHQRYQRLMLLHFFLHPTPHLHPRRPNSLPNATSTHTAPLPSPEGCGPVRLCSMEGWMEELARCVQNGTRLSSCPVFPFLIALMPPLTIGQPPPSSLLDTPTPTQHHSPIGAGHPRRLRTTMTAPQADDVAA